MIVHHQESEDSKRFSEHEFILDTDLITTQTDENELSRRDTIEGLGNLSFQENLDFFYCSLSNLLLRPLGLYVWYNIFPDQALGKAEDVNSGDPTTTEFIPFLCL